MPSIAIPVSLRGQLLNSVRAVTAFSPSTLFALNEPGVWYDPSDVANLAWRRNLLTWTEQFDNAAVWFPSSGTTISPNVATAPNGTTTADRVVNLSAGAGDRLVQQVTVANQTLCGSIWLRGQGADIGKNVDVSAKRVGGTFVGNVVTHTLTDQWVRVSVSFTQIAGNTGAAFNLVTSSSNPATDVLIWGAQLELGSVATDYQRISNVNTEVIERFPSATLYQDAVGTIPVTAPGDPVGLVLDKSKGLVLGSELVTNGDFLSGTTGWATSGTLPSTATVTAGEFVVSAASANGRQISAITCVIGRTYKVTGFARVSSGTGSALISISDNTAGLSERAGTTTLSTSPTALTLVFVATQTTHYVTLGNASSGTGDKIFDNISVKELPGFHATQATLASRPTYGIVPATGRRNLLTRTEEFGDAVWFKTSGGVGSVPIVTANFAAAPDGTMTAGRVQFNLNGGTSGSDQSQISQAVTFTATNYTASFWLRSNTGSDFTIFLLVENNQTVLFTVTPTWQRLSGTRLALGLGSIVGLRARGGATSNAPDLLVWGAQLETGSSATAYQRVGSAFDVTEAGVASLSYLSFDGVDDSLVTPTITPGIDRAQVFAGVRKLSDANIGVMIESSALVTNAGTFSVYAPNTAGTYASLVNGSALGGINYTTFTAPITNVISSLYDISQATVASEITFRANGAVVSGSSFGAASAGTGNFLAYPLYIGRRGGTSLPFNGNLFSLIVRFGTNLDAGTITSTETWVNGKTGAYA